MGPSKDNTNDNTWCAGNQTMPDSINCYTRDIHESLCHTANQYLTLQAIPGVKLSVVETANTKFFAFMLKSNSDKHLACLVNVWSSYFGKTPDFQNKHSMRVNMFKEVIASLAQQILMGKIRSFKNQDVLPITVYCTDGMSGFIYTIAENRECRIDSLVLKDYVVAVKVDVTKAPGSNSNELSWKNARHSFQFFLCSKKIVNGKEKMELNSVFPIASGAGFTPVHDPLVKPAENALYFVSDPGLGDFVNYTFNLSNTSGSIKYLKELTLENFIYYGGVNIIASPHGYYRIVSQGTANFLAELMWNLKSGYGKAFLEKNPSSELNTGSILQILMSATSNALDGSSLEILTLTKEEANSEFRIWRNPLYTPGAILQTFFKSPTIKNAFSVLGQCAYDPLGAFYYLGKLRIGNKELVVEIENKEYPLSALKGVKTSDLKDNDIKIPDQYAPEYILKWINEKLSSYFSATETDASVDIGVYQSPYGLVFVGMNCSFQLRKKDRGNLDPTRSNALLMLFDRDSRSYGSLKSYCMQINSPGNNQQKNLTVSFKADLSDPTSAFLYNLDLDFHGPKFTLEFSEKVMYKMKEEERIAKTVLIARVFVQFDASKTEAVLNRLPKVFDNDVSKFVISSFARNPEVPIKYKGANLSVLPISLTWFVKFFSQFYNEDGTIKTTSVDPSAEISGNVRITAFDSQGRRIDGELGLKSSLCVQLTMSALEARMKYNENKNKVYKPIQPTQTMKRKY